MSFTGAKKRILVTGVACAAIAAGYSQPALAEGPSPAGKSPDENADATDQSFNPPIIVTATKRASALQDTPISISAFSEDYLQRNNVAEFSDFADAIPNVSAPDGLNGAGQALTIRGITSQTRQGSNIEQPAGAYLDQVFVGARGFLDHIVYDLDRIEVLRGPQGTLWGRNTASGAISYTTRRPTDDFEGYARLEYGNYDLLSAEGAVSGPLAGDAIQFRLSGLHHERDGYVKNISGNGSYGTENQDSVRLQLEIHPTADLEVFLIGQYLDSHRIDAIATWSGGPGYDGPSELAVEDVYGKRSGATNLIPRVSEDLYGLTSIINWYLGEFQVSSVTGYQKGEVRGHLDDEGTALDIVEYAFGVGENPETTERFSQELRLTTPRLADFFDFTLGLYYYDEQFSTETATRVGTYVVDKFGLELPLDAAALVERERDSSGIKSQAAFGQGNFYLTDSLTALAGFRVTSEQKDFAFSQAVSFLDEAGTALLDVPFGDQIVLDRFEDTVFTGMLGLQYEFTRNSMAYGTYSEGYKSGGFNRSYVTAPEVISPFFGPERVTNYEAGLRTQWFGRRLTANLTAFYMDYTGLQVDTRSISDMGQVVSQIVNAGSARSKGIELELSASPVRAWSMWFNFGLLDAKFTEFVNADGQDLSGNRLPFAPTFNSSLGSRYDLDLGEGRLVYFQGEWAHSAGYYTEVENRAAGHQEKSNILNARIAFVSSDERLELGLWGRNLTDVAKIVDYNRAVEDNVALFEGALFRAYSAPRTYGLDLKYRF